MVPRRAYLADISWLRALARAVITGTASLLVVIIGRYRTCRPHRCAGCERRACRRPHCTGHIYLSRSCACAVQSPPVADGELRGSSCCAGNPLLRRSCVGGPSCGRSKGSPYSRYPTVVVMYA
ncbi:hypothetical protein FKP32DRAFT_1120853 [Trametes sanguinea]|nr:hypothetical protein FKP32DRAFT_1120853 [Trametes sanguinea]